ncbi:hypothetical protein J6A31_05955 [bacterium]|nr:hypothetical protein [bacterium]
MHSTKNPDLKEYHFVLRNGNFYTCLASDEAEANLLYLDANAQVPQLRNAMDFPDIESFLHYLKTDAKTEPVLPILDVETGKLFCPRKPEPKKRVISVIDPAMFSVIKEVIQMCFRKKSN